MRRDMERKIKEKGKGGGWGGNANRRRRTKFRTMNVEDMDTLPDKEGMRRPHVLHWGGKHAQENLNPLYRYLNSQAGCKWDDVYSEVCEQIKDTNIRECVFYIVEDKVKIINGKPYKADIRYNYGSRDEIPIEQFRWSNRTYKMMYVDPRDGILKFAPDAKKRSKREKRHPDRVYSTDRLIQYHRINDVWYEILFRDLQDKDFKTTNYLGYSMPEYRWYVIAHDMLYPDGNWYPDKYHPYPTKGEWIHRYGDLILPIRKRQLNSKEIKRLKLK